MKAEAAMRLALRAARTVEGLTYPNPPVGAVVFRGERVLGRGATRPVGGSHAEVVALEAAVRRFGEKSLRGAAMAVTLEPCCHVGRTGPCTGAIVDAGLRRVYVGHTDPHPGVAGRGVRDLRRAGVEVAVGVLENECRNQHRGFLTVCDRGRPFVMLKLASSLDGRIALAGGESRWITGPQARAIGHRLRARSDAILIGSMTAVADDPEFVARRGNRVIARPIRVLVDSRLRVPASAKLYAEGADRTWVLCGKSAAASRRNALERTDARVLTIAMRDGHIALKPALALLAREGLTQILVEGGGELAAALLRSKLVDELHWFVAPRILGGDGRASMGALGLARLVRSPEVEARVGRAGRDVYIRGHVRYPDRKPASAQGRTEP
ncbi:MAG: bifunctional diaminohydroxyphosphoribosylaminopyrimidine deaminase/5-amino-6-(5-phosphoribosylamino)uracil reductase RibD [Myxococcota bacterium]